MSKNDVKIIDCKKSCKMARQIRESKFCTGQAKVVGTSIFYGCKEGLKEEPKEVRQFYACDLWNVGLEESCFSCKLECVNNKNEELKDVLAEKKELDKVIKELKPNMLLYGVTSEQVEKISSTYTSRQSDGKRNELGSEAISAASFANNALKMIMKGRRVDLAYFALYAKKKSGKIKRLSKKSSKKSKS